MTAKYRYTFAVSLVGYVCQAVVNMFAPLLFVTFMTEFDLSAGLISTLVVINFGVQLAVDLLSAGFVDKVGQKPCMIAAHFFIVAGLVLLAVLPYAMPAFAGLTVAVCVYAVGGGLLEVLVSPVVENLPTENKEGSMSFLHSFYCWGVMLVVLLSTAYFAAFGTANWRVLALLWAVLPAVNGVLFLFAPFGSPREEESAPAASVGLGGLLKNKTVWLLMLFMLCAGASEQAVSQWSSTFAEQGLGVDKTLGDLIGVCGFALMMGISRMLYSLVSRKSDVGAAINVSAALCVISYLGITLVPVPAVNLACCCLCGLSVGVLWPGVFSIAARTCRNGGTALFALLALAGDVGCSAGPAVAGGVTEAAGALKWGILAAVIFPALLLATFAPFSLRRKTLSDRGR